MKKSVEQSGQASATMAPIAIVGIGCIFPQAEDKVAFWSNIRSGRDAITEVPASHWRPEDYFNPDPKAPDQVYAKMGGFLPTVDFHPMEYGILPNALEAVDTAQLLGLVAVEQALVDAGYSADKVFDREKVSVILGVTGSLELVIPLGARLGHPRWRAALKEAGVADDIAADAIQRISDSYVPWQENSFPGLLGNVVAGRISKHFNFGGTNCVVDSACGSSLSALNLAALELSAGKADMVVTGGVDTFNDIFMYTCFSKTPALSPSGHARPFDANGDGTTLGEGLGFVVLKRLADAERDGDRIYAVIRGLGTSSDGRGSAIYEPSAAGQEKALRRAYQQGNVTPETIELIEAHGTGTKVGDAVEVKALRQVFGEGERPWCSLGSVKSQIGHTKAAAGSAGLIKATLALYHKILPPTLKVQKPQEVVVGNNSPFYLDIAARPWIANPDHPRRAGVSALGFGGSNFHCLLEEYQAEKVVVDESGEVQIAAFSAADVAGLESLLRAFPADAAWAELRLAAGVSRQQFDPQMACRLSLVMEKGKSNPPAQIKSALSMLAKSGGQSSWQTPDGVYFASGAAVGKLAILFPGQGAQYPGMLAELALQFPEFFTTVQAADDAFAAAVGASGRLAEAIYPRGSFDDARRQADVARLQATEVAQPALGAVSLGALKVLNSFALQADAFAGHSYGELTALCAGGYFDESALHRLSRRRGELMAAGEGDRGTMLAVSAPLAAVEKLLVEEGLDLVLANRNTPEQGVLSGSTAEIAKAAKLLEARGLRYKELTVAAAFHSPLVASASAPFAAALADTEFQTGQMPVFANSSGQAYPASADGARQLLSTQLASPVEFVSEIESLYSSGIRTFVEVGPGARLTGMVKAILVGREHQAIALDSSGGQRSAIHDLARTLSQLAVFGYGIDLTSWDADYAQERAQVAKKKGMVVPLCGANYFNPPAKRPALTPQPLAAAAAVVAPASLPPVATGAPTPPAAPAALQDALRLTQQSMQALQTLQEQTSRLHQQFLSGQEAATRSFLTLIEQQRQMLYGGAPMAASLPVVSVAPPVVASVDGKYESSGSYNSPASPESHALPVPAPAISTSSDRVNAVLLGIVAEKTGYPLEMLELDMALDADLGIDSIKRVEILSALHEQLPEAPAIRPEHLGTLQTLGQIVDHLQAGLGPVTVAANAAPSLAPESGLVTQTLLNVIAEKTGYPLEMLELDMALDADLGIDSIKRVEIFAALQSELPNAPAVRPEQLGSLQTLGQIVTYLVAATTTPAPMQLAVKNEQIDRTTVAEALLSVIADKTGYPLEMLELDMALDADLGIDSIKRVEILSALQERLPAAPAIRPEHLGTLQTVGQIVDFLASVAGAPAAPVAQTPTVVTEVGGEGVTRQVLKAVPLPASSKREGLALPPGAVVGVINDGSELTPALDSELTLLGFTPRILAIDQPLPPQLDGLIILSPAAGSSDLFLLQAFQTVQASTGTVQALLTVSRLNGYFGLLPGSDLHDPLSGGLAGLCKTAGHEWPQVSCKALDLAIELPAAVAAKAIVNELLLLGPGEVGISAQGLHSLKLSAAPLTESGALPPLQSGDLVVISGGARGVTAEVAIDLAAATQATLLLFGRSPAPQDEPAWLQKLCNEAEIKRALLSHAETPLKPKEVEERYQTLLGQREITNNLQRMRAAGSEVHYLPLDLRDRAAVAAAITDLRRSHGPVKGLIHGAGVLADRLIKDKTVEQFSAVYSTKVEGLRSLLAALAIDELKFIALFSSSTGRFGRTGQVDYAVANEVLNKLAQQEARLRPDCRVVALNWGPWDGGMVTPALKKLFVAEGVEVIALRAGSAYLLQELATPPGGATELVILGAHAAEPAEEVEAPRENIYVSKAFDLDLSIEQFPFLKSHVIDKKAVLPLAMIVEWLGHGAIHNNPGLRFHGFNDLRVLKGVTLEAGQLHNLQVMTGKAFKSGGFHVVPVELSGSSPSGQHFIHARAKIVLANRLPEGKTATERQELPLYPHPQAEIYRPERLFHGVDFHALREVIGCASEGITALSRPAPQPSAWISHPLRNSWLADPLVLDASFQLMILWSFERYQAASLPVFAGRYRQYSEKFPECGAEIRIRVSKQNSHKATAEIDFVHPLTGELLARLEDYECVIDASLNETFQRNTLQGATRA
ncbi:MAG: SDR family NAD(P)-dependent oxidoreductase [Desulfuromonadales bacterium]|nr:SDR family NAD(P)-dependent oxidoreductase [Desulfuromonadales bacterium]